MDFYAKSEWIGKILNSRPTTRPETLLDKYVEFVGEKPEKSEFLMPVEFLFCRSPNQIYVRPKTDKVVFQALRMKLQEVYSQSPPAKIILNVGWLCAVCCENLWIRARVIEVNLKQCTVQDFDTAILHTIPYDLVYPLMEPFNTVSSLYITCSLADVYPPLGKWNPEVSRFITNKLIGTESIFVSRRKELTEVLNAVIYFGKKSLGGPLKNSGMKLHNLNEKLISKTLVLKSPRSLQLHLPTISAWPIANRTMLPRTFVAWVSWLTFKYIHLIDQSVLSRLREMSAYLTEECNDSQPSDEDLQCQVGDMVIAK